MPRLKTLMLLLGLVASSTWHTSLVAQTVSEDGANALAARLGTLLANATAGAPSLPQGTPFLVQFDADVGGLAVGAPVTVKGIRIGTVRDVQVVIDSEQGAINVPVIIDVVPERLRVDGAAASNDDEVYSMAETLVAKGLRAALVTATPLGGSQHVTLTFVAEAPAETLDRSGRYPELPTAPTFGDQLQANAQSLIERLGALPVEEAVDEATLTFSELRAVLTGPEMQRTLKSLGTAGAELEAVVTGPEMQEAVRQAAEAAGQFGNFVASLDTQLEPSIAAMQRAVGSIEKAAGEVAASISGLEDYRGAAFAALGRAFANQPRTRQFNTCAQAARRISRTASRCVAAGPPGDATLMPVSTTRRFGFLRQKALFLAAMLLAGCGGTPPSRYYHMAAGPPATPAPGEQSSVIIVDRVAMAAYADRSPLVMRVGPSEVSFAEFDAWAEPVSGQIATVVADALGDQFGREQVMIKADRLHQTPDFLVDLDVIRFEIDADNNALLDARWTLLQGSQEAVAAQGREWITRMPKEAESFDARAQALTATLIALADRIGASIESASLR